MNVVVGRALGGGEVEYWQDNLNIVGAVGAVALRTGGHTAAEGVLVGGHSHMSPGAGVGLAPGRIREGVGVVDMASKWGHRQGSSAVAEGIRSAILVVHTTRCGAAETVGGRSGRGAEGSQGIEDGWGSCAAAAKVVRNSCRRSADGTAGGTGGATVGGVCCASGKWPSAELYRSWTGTMDVMRPWRQLYDSVANFESGWRGARQK